MVHHIVLNQKENLRGKYLYLLGGFYSEDSGCPAWGTTDPADIRFIGDTLGELIIKFADESEGKVPLVLGYTLWLHSIWQEFPAPFFGDAKDGVLTDKLKECLCVFGAWEGEDTGVLRIELPDKSVKSASVVPNPDKKGTPIFTDGYITDENCGPFGNDKITVNPDDPFFLTHTVSLKQSVPEKVRENLDAICFALHTFDSDFETAPEAFVFPKEPDTYKIRFTGSKIAEIATGVVYHNMENLKDRTDDDGFIHTSYVGAPSWRYDGFGPYLPSANSYTQNFYSRDAARAIMTLNSFGHIEKAKSGCDFGNRWMMAYPEQDVTLGGKPIPGHFSVMPNDPFVYSKYLTEHGWPTKYTKERFGEEYQNLGNQETDGHGLMMMSNFLVWCNSGKSADFINESRRYIDECVKWIMWCFDNPELSFVKDDLLYGETEAAMNTYTLYANIPVLLGLLGYIEMIKSVGDTETVQLWQKYADRLRGGINKALSKDGVWDCEKFGFYHDPVLTMMADVMGYDICDMPTDWVERSADAYKADLEKTVEYGWIGASGIGYNHSMITQNALLLDKTEDASKLVESLSKLSYAPRLPEPYLIPEGLSADVKKGIYRRQGDLANLVQLAEAMKCYLIAIGISPMQDGVLKIMPRLPRGWNASVEKFPVQNSKMLLTMQVDYPTGNRQSINLSVENPDANVKLRLRFGPFDYTETEAEVTLNETLYRLPLEVSGDRKWAWLES